MKTQPILLATALALACGPAAASSHEHGMDADDMRCEMKGHGKMDAAGRKEMMDRMFAKADANGDGAISRAEFDKHHEMMWAKTDEERKPKAHDHVEQHK
jgi:hypothetical protein